MYCKEKNKKQRKIEQTNILRREKKQARKPRSYASSKLRLTDSLTDLLTGVKCRATSVAKKFKIQTDKSIHLHI